MIRPVKPDDAAVIAEIYNHYILETSITFEEQAVSAEIIRDRIHKVKAAGLPWLVVEDHQQVVGYAYAAPWRERSAYRFSVEVTVYLSGNTQGKGLGSALYQSLFDELKQSGIRCAIAGITLPNAPSIGLHEKMGMKKVAHFEQVGYKFNQWLDVGYWQIELQSGQTA